CFDTFATHVRRLFATVLPLGHYVHVQTSADNDAAAIMSFYKGDKPAPVRIKTDYGPLYLHLAQALVAEREKTRYRLATHLYWYRVQQGESLKEQALLRWEYVKNSTQKFCRHHIQQRAAIKIGQASLDLNKAHVPTGWVTIEEVLRFLIV